MQSKFYLFGAGINCAAVIKFLGKSNIIAIIDSDKRLQESTFDGIPIISLQRYINENHREKIAISGYYSAEKIANALIEKKITDFYVCPCMQNGFYSSGLDIAVKLNLFQYCNICFFSNNPLSEAIIYNMRMEGYSGRFYFLDSNKNEVKDAVLIVTNIIEKEQYIKSEDNYLEIIDINDIYMKQYAYKNSKLEKFKNIYAGKRCFIIGNGPSLTYQDLQKLYNEKEICFGVNRIYFAYEYTDWRPDYYVACDYFIIKKDTRIIQQLNTNKFIRHLYNENLFDGQKDIYEYRGLVESKSGVGFSDDIVKGVCIGRTVVYDAIQIAAYMGFSEIYLLGVDMSENMVAEAEGAHFYKSPDINEHLMKSDRDTNLRAMRNARIHMESQGRILKNATRNAKWNEIEKVDFDCLFGSKN